MQDSRFSRQWKCECGLVDCNIFGTVDWQPKDGRNRFLRNVSKAPTLSHAIHLLTLCLELPFTRREHTSFYFETVWYPRKIVAKWNGCRLQKRHFKTFKLSHAWLIKFQKAETSAFMCISHFQPQQRKHKTYGRETKFKICAFVGIR